MEFAAADYAPVLPPESDEVQYALALYSMVEQLLLAVPQERVQEAFERLGALGEPAYAVGRVIPLREKKEQLIIL